MARWGDGYIVASDLRERAERAERERDELREALERIVRLRRKWDAPLSGLGAEATGAWAAVGSDADRIARFALSPKPEGDDG